MRSAILSGTGGAWTVCVGAGEQALTAIRVSAHAADLICFTPTSGDAIGVLRELRRLAGISIAAFAVACGGADPSWPVTEVVPPDGLPALSPGPGGIVLTVGPGSRAVVRVREQLATLVSPTDAVLSADRITGRVAMRRDGTFLAGSRIVVALDDLRSDNAQRDRYIRNETLRTREHPLAEFVPIRATGLSLPLRADGEAAFKLTGTMTIRGQAREVAFDVTAARVGRDVMVTARTATTWRFGDFGLEIPRVLSVLSIVDEIRLEVQLVATDRQG